jgi:hypothetical protein
MVQCPAPSSSASVFRPNTALGPFSFSNFLRSASRGDVPFTVADDPVRSLREFSFLISALSSEVESRSLASTRHSSLIKLMLARVVPAIRSTMRRQRANSFLNPDVVIEPSGKARAAATESLSGVCLRIAQNPRSNLLNYFCGHNISTERYLSPSGQNDCSFIFFGQRTA